MFSCLVGVVTICWRLKFCILSMKSSYITLNLQLHFKDSVLQSMQGRLKSPLSLSLQCLGRYDPGRLMMFLFSKFDFLRRPIWKSPNNHIILFSGILDRDDHNSKREFSSFSVGL